MNVKLCDICEDRIFCKNVSGMKIECHINNVNQPTLDMQDICLPCSREVRHIINNIRERGKAE